MLLKKEIVWLLFKQTSVRLHAAKNDQISKYDVSFLDPRNIKTNFEQSFQFRPLLSF